MDRTSIQYFDDDELQQIVTRRELKLQKRKNKRSIAQYKDPRSERIEIRSVLPLTDNQQKAFEAFSCDQNILLHGVAGTGKTFIALYLALNSIIKAHSPKSITILRSVVPSRNMGFLPGKLEEKIAVYEDPYRSLCAELSGHPTAYDYLKRNKYIQFSTTSYLRGLTFLNNIIIVDECQNMSFAELDTIMTRVGKGCRVILCGDFRQSDLLKSEERRGVITFMNILHKMRSFSCIEFTKDDIVRSSLVKEYIIAKLNNGIV